MENSSDTGSKLKFFDPSHPLSHIGKKIFIAVSLLGIVIFYYIKRYSKGTEVLRTLLKVAPQLIIVMLLVESAYFLVQGNFFQRIYRVLGFERSITYLTTLYIGMNLVNTMAPVAGLSGSLYMGYLESKNEVGHSQILLINFIYYMTDYLVFLLVLLTGLLYLFITGEITKTIIITSLIFTLFVVMVGILGIAIISRPAQFSRFIAIFSSFIHRIIRKEKPKKLEQSVTKFFEDAQDAWQQGSKNWSYLYEAAGFAFLLHVCCLSLLALSFKAFGIPIVPQIVVAGYTVGTLLNIVSITPGGLGFAEGGMTAVFAALGVPVEQALLVTLLYRAVFVWFPLLVGSIIIHILPRMAAKQPRRLLSP